MNLQKTSELALAAMFGGYILTESALLEPIRDVVQSELEQRAEAGSTLASWALDGVSCSTCSGVWASFFAVAVRRGRGYDITDVMAANGLALLLASIDEKLRS